MIRAVGALHPEVRIGAVLPAVFVLVRGLVVGTVVAGTPIPRAAASCFRRPATKSRRSIDRRSRDQCTGYRKLPEIRGTLVVGVSPEVLRCARPVRTADPVVVVRREHPRQAELQVGVHVLAGPAERKRRSSKRRRRVLAANGIVVLLRLMNSLFAGLLARACIGSVNVCKVRCVSVEWFWSHFVFEMEERTLLILSNKDTLLRSSILWQFTFLCV